MEHLEPYDEEVVHGTDVAIVEQQPVTLFGTNDPLQVIDRATEVANKLKDVLVAKKLTTNIKGKEHVRVEGWQLLGNMVGVTAVCVKTERIDFGWKATVEARTLQGVVVGCADAICTSKEKSGPWKNADDYALISMAQTRACSKALKGPLGFVVSLAGYETTPAEEMTFADAQNVTSVEDKIQAKKDSLDFGDDPIVADSLKVAFKALHFSLAKVALHLGECHTQEDREQLLQMLQASMATEVVDAEVVE